MTFSIPASPPKPLSLHPPLPRKPDHPRASLGVIAPILGPETHTSAFFFLYSFLLPREPNHCNSHYPFDKGAEPFVNLGRSIYSLFCYPQKIIGFKLKLLTAPQPYHHATPRMLMWVFRQRHFITAVQKNESNDTVINDKDPRR